MGKAKTISHREHSDHREESKILIAETRNLEYTK